MLTQIFGTISGSLFKAMSGGALKAIGGQLNQAYQAKLNAQNDTQRIDADKRIATLHAQQTVFIAEQGSKITRWIRPAFALPFVVYNFKIIIWDKVLNQGTTDALSPEFWQLQMIVFGAYFLTRPFEKK
tara:strand:- start:813 stop:1199 length:387 start_codon:yes stop_codon:yes gene_type:complete